MADFDPTTIPQLVLGRLDGVAADCVQQGQKMFAQALDDQRKLLEELLGPSTPLMKSTSTRAGTLAAGPPPKPKATDDEAGGGASEAEASGGDPASGQDPAEAGGAA